MKKIFLILCLLAFTGTAFAEVDYNRKSSPLSVGETDKYYKDINSWDSRNLYVPGQPYHQPYDYSYSGGQPSSSYGTQGTQPKTNQGSNINSQGTKVKDGEVEVAETQTTDVQSTKSHKGTGYRWGKNPNEIHYNFGGTGFKSKGYSQGYGQNQ